MISTLNTMAEHWVDWQVAMLWQTAVLIGILWIVDVVIRKWAHPQVRYALWMLVLIKLLIPPTWTSPASITSRIPDVANRAATVMERADNSAAAQAARSGTRPSRSQTEQLPAGRPRSQVVQQGQKTIAAGATPGIKSSPPAPVASQHSEDGKGQSREAGRGSLSWKTYAMLTWLIGMLTLSTWLFIRLSGLRREHLKDGQALPERFYTQLEEVAAKLGLKRLPRVVLTNKVACPAVFGIFRPVLLMPAAKFKTMSARDTEHILLHELAHIKRGDLVVHAVWMLVQIVYWFNPLLWMIRRTLQNLRELCCDATVARLLREKTVHYRETLLETARQLLAEPVDPGLGLLGLFENNNWLVTRLQWLEKNTWKNRPLRIATIITLVAVMTTCVMPMANRPQKTEVSSQKSEGLEKLVIEHFIENRNRLESCVLSWTRTVKDDGFTEAGRAIENLEYGGSYQLWWDGTKTATKYITDQVCGDVYDKDKIWIQKENGGHTYGGHFWSIKPRYRPHENWLQVIGWYHSMPLDEDIKNRKKRDYIRMDWSVIEQDGVELVKLTAENIESREGVEKGARSEELFDAQKGYSLISRQWYDGSGRLYMKEICHYKEVIPGLWFPCEVHFQSFGVDGKAELSQRLVLSLDQCRFNDPEAVSKEAFGKELPTNNYTATLPNGVTVELLGVCEHPSEGKQWWRPDGSLLAESPGNMRDIGGGADRKGESAYELVARLTGPDTTFDRSETPERWNIPKARKVGLGKSGTCSDKNGTPCLRATTVRIKKSIETVDVEFGLAGQWKKLMSVLSNETNSKKHKETDLVVKPPYEKDGRAVITIKVPNKTDKKMAVKVCAVLENGKKVWNAAYSRNSEISFLASTDNYEFVNLKLSEVKKFDIYTSEYKWATFKNVALRPKDVDKKQVQGWVEDFFKHNYRDITARKTLEWGEPVVGNDDSISIRYKYEATIWGKDKKINDEVFRFAKDGTFIYVRDFGAEDIYSLPGAQALVEDFFANNYRDITHRETIEWGEPVKDENGNVSIRYKYEATIWDTDTVINNEIYTFDKNGKFISVKIVGLKDLDTYKNIDPNELGITVYNVNKIVSSFPESLDFSLPENTYVMAQRIIAEGNNSAWPEISASGLAARMRKTQKQSQKTVSPERAKKELSVKVLEVYKKGNYAGVIGRNPGLLPSYDTRSFKLENGKWLNRGNSGARTLATARAIVMQGIDYHNWQETENSTNSEPPTTDSQNYTATLPNGVTVKLLGLCSGMTDEDRVWWTPDGCIAESNLFEKYSKDIKPKNWDDRQLMYAYLYRVESAKVNASDSDVSAGDRWHGNYSGDNVCIGYVYSDKERVSNFPATGGIKVAVSAGGYESFQSKLHNGTVSDASILVDGKTNVTVSGPRITSGKQHYLDVNVNSNEYDIQVTYELNNGAIKNADRDGRMGGPHMTSFYGKQNPIIRYDFAVHDDWSKIRALIIKYRKYEVVTFKNVALRPGGEVQSSVISEQLSENKAEETKAWSGSDTIASSSASGPEASREKPEWVVANDSGESGKAGQPQIAIEAKVFTAKVTHAEIAEQLKASGVEVKLNPQGLLSFTALTDAQSSAFEKWMASLAGTSALICPKVRVFDGEKTRMALNDTQKFTTGYDGDTPKVDEFTTGVTFEFTPTYQKQDDVIRLTLAFDKKMILDVMKQTDDSGKETEMPGIGTKSVHTTIAIPQGQTMLVPVAGIGGMAGMKSPDSKTEQIFLLIKAEIETQSSVSGPQGAGENVKMIRAQIEILENCKSGEREKWFAAVKVLVDIGSPAVPALSEAIRKTNRPRAQSTMALTLRAIGDPQAVPALIDALEKSGFSSDYGVGDPDTELAKFIHKLQMDPSNDDITLGRPVREITISLERLTGHTEGHGHFHAYDENGRRLGSYTVTPEIRDREKEHRKQVAQKWRSWWENLQKSRSHEGGTLASGDGSVLELYILPEPDKEDWAGLTPDDVAQYRGSLQTEGPWTGSMRGDSYQWALIDDGFQDDGLIVETYQGERYADRFEGKRFVLYAARAAYRMIPDDSWGLKEVVADSDNNGRPAIRIIFDPAGAEQFNTLTKSNINRRLAILIDGKVITAPQIMMALSGQAMITGGFTEEEANKMAAELKKGMPPVTLRPGGETEVQP